MTAEQRIKKAFPDWKDWPEWALSATIEVMNQHAEECCKATLENASNNAKTISYATKMFGPQCEVLKTSITSESNIILL